MSDGSFTQNLNSLTNETIYIELISKSNDIQIDNLNDIREVLLQDYSNQNLAFAKSLCLKNLYQSLQLPRYQPIGKSLIKLRKDIYKEIHEIYYGYSQYLNNLFKINEPLWSRKYTLYYQNQPFITIQEFFSPKLIKFFKPYKQ